MKKKFKLLIIGGTAIYAIVSAILMIGFNKVPYQISCIGKQLNPKEVILFSNQKFAGKDTIIFPYSKQKFFMPGKLGMLKYNTLNKEYEVKLDTSIASQNETNTLKPFCKRLDNEGSYIDPISTINEKLLIRPGIKINSNAGTVADRIAIKIMVHKNKKYILYNQEGMNTQYMVRSGVDTFDVFVNMPVSSKCKYIFSFTETTDTSHTSIITNASLLSLQINTNGLKQKYITFSDTFYFTSGEWLFKINTKYSIPFVLFFVFFIVFILVFQINLFKHYSLLFNAPTIKSLIAIRIYLNALILLSTPILLSAWYLTNNRLVFLILVLLFNCTYFLPKRYFHKFGFIYSKFFLILLFIVWSSITVLLIAFNKNECLFTIPILHVSKFLILIMLLMLNVFNVVNNKKWHIVKYLLVLIYSCLLSILTQDIGSILFIIIAFSVILLLKNSITIKQLIIGIGIVSLVVATCFKVFPDTISKNKTYRLLAPYVSPENSNLRMTNESDRETYANLILNLKNVIKLNAPLFNNVHITPSMRSTLFSDYAVHWSYIFGGLYFIVLFIPTIILLIYEYILLLYMCLYEVAISNNNSFSLKYHNESEILRFFLAITIVQTIYPILSNLLLIPISGQSVPMFCVSNWEVIFITVLVIWLESIFTNNTKYINTINNRKIIGFGNILNYRKKIMLNAIIIVLITVIIKSIQIFLFPDSLSWKKFEVKNNLPNITNNEKLIECSNQIINSSKDGKIKNADKLILKNLACKYYSNKTYQQLNSDSYYFDITEKEVCKNLSINNNLSIEYNRVSGNFNPYGQVFRFIQYVNNKPVFGFTNKWYKCVKINDSNNFNDLTAECNSLLEKHISEIGNSNNIGAINIINNTNGQILVNSTYPLSATKNSNEINYKIGSVKKILIFYAAIQLIPDIQNRKINNRSFSEFIQWSDNIWATTLLKELLSNHLSEFEQLLKQDFNLPLYDNFMDGFLERPFSAKDLNDFSYLQRMAIGHEKTYNFLTVLNWYVNIGAKSNLSIKYSNTIDYHNNLSINNSNYVYLKESFNEVLNGTASIVKQKLEDNNINTEQFICKTGTAEKENKDGNYSSTFIIVNNSYTMGIMLSGDLPPSSKKQMAKDVFVKLLPLLLKYKILNQKNSI